MKKIMSMLVLAFLFSCTNTSKLIEQKKYDDAMAALVQSLQKNPTDSKKIAQLDFVMIETSGNELAEIEKLKLSGRPDIWEDVLIKYHNLSERQDKLSVLPDTTLALMQFKPGDYTAFTSQAKDRATQFYYAAAIRQLESKNPADHQLAFKNLNKVNELTPGFKDVNNLLSDFKQIVPRNILYKVRNQFPGYLPSELERELKYLDMSSLNTAEFRFYQKQTRGVQMDYNINIEIQDVKIMPENTQEIYYVETAKVQDGIGYKLDENNDFIYDSLGRKIEFPLLKTIACYVSETIKEKSMLIGGSVEITEIATGMVIAKQYITGEARFLNRSAIFKGDLNALTAETFELVGTKEAEYPTDLGMILRASDRFKLNALDFILDEMSKLSPVLTKIE